MFTRITSHKAAISTKAKSGRWSPKKRYDHEAFRNSWNKKSPKATLAPKKPARRQTSHAASPMNTYNVDQTGVNTKLGGFQLGFAKAAYHSPGENLEPTQPVASETPSQHIRPINDFAICNNSSIQLSYSFIGGPELTVRCSRLCMAGTSVNLWGANPLYLNPVNVMFIDTNTRQWQGRNHRAPCEGRRSAKL